MTPYEAKRANALFKDYHFRALLSVLTKEQREQYDTYLKANLPKLEVELKSFMAPHEANEIIKEISNKIKHLYS